MKIGDFLFEAETSEILPLSEPASDDDESIVGVFARIVAAHPGRTAVADEAGSITFEAIDALSDRIGRFVHGLGLAAESRIGLMFDRDRHFVAAALGVLKAGCAYVPVDPMLPPSHRRRLLELAEAPLLVSQASLVRDLHLLQWSCPSLRDILCIDAEALDALVEPPGIMMAGELWEHLAGDDADDIAAGGWKSAFTGLPIPAEAMAAFGSNARAKVAALLKPGARVLEIGCASGFTMRHVAPLTGTYVATDIARRNVERVEAHARRHGLDQVTGRQLAAHDVDVYPSGSFDLVILNSVIESFPGFGYLRDVLDKVTALLAPGGAIFAGSIWDLEKRDGYLADLAAFARDNAGKGYQTRSGFAEDLFVPRAFFSDWAAERGGEPSVIFSAVEAPGFEPARYGYDAVIRPQGGGGASVTVKRRHDAASLDGLPPGPPPIEVASDRLAYVIFTSGTTGDPKGAMIEHRSVVNLARHVAETLFAPLGSALSVSCIASFSFDSSVKQVFATLLNGHTLHIPGEDTKRDPARLHAFITERHLDLCDPTPSLFSLLVDHWVEAGTATAARTFILGGEVVQADLLRRFYGCPGHGDARVVNAYGPTETCVAATQHIMTAGSWQEILPPPIGIPLRGVAVQVCDGAGRPLPEGVPGEIRIGGAGVGRGYLDDPGQTAQRFVCDASGRRWYRTGDIGRWLPGGVLAFLGREDRQVKIRGNRIELAEVEAAIASHPTVRRAVVVALDLHGDGNRLLAAYIVPRPGFDLAACKSALDAQLPPFMVPSWLVPVDDIPLTRNGKVDEARLPRPSIARPSAAARPPSSETERRLAALWSDILNVAVEDADADFFTLGGHSVLAVRLVAAVERTFGTRLPLSDLFAHPTIARLARRIDSRALRSDWHPMVAVNTAGPRPPIVCFHPVGGNVLCYQRLAEELGSDQPLYMVQAFGLEEGQTLLPTVEEMTASYLEAMRGIVPEGPLVFAGWSFGGLLAYEAACRLTRAGVAIQAVLLFDAVAVPHSIKELLRQDEATYLATLFEELGVVDAATLRPLSPEQRLDLLVERGRGSDLLPDHADREWMRRLLGVFQNNALAAVRYRPRRIEHRILLVRPRLASASAPGVPGDDFNGWMPLAEGGVDLRWIGGTHGQMLDRPHVGDLARHVQDYLDDIPPNGRR
jgi:amino acid adenylation domain-containing protein